MIKVETDIDVSRDELYSFIESINYRPHSLWPNNTKENNINLLLDELGGIQEDYKIKAFYSDQLMAVIAFDTLEWDSRHFGYQCARIHHLLTRGNGEREIIKECLEKCVTFFQKKCSETGIRLVSADIDSQEPISHYALQDAGFDYILTWIDGFFKGSYPEISLAADAEVSNIRPDEVIHFSKLAATHYYKGGRFYSDSRFDPTKVNEMYGGLVETSFKNGDILLVYRIRGEPVGLFICKKIFTYTQFSDLKVAPLRFLIVDPLFRQKGIARILFAKTIEFLNHQCDIITTGLEVHNLASLNLHMKMGFKFNYTHNAFHWWNPHL